jgi:hypothetical protein
MKVNVQEVNHCEENALCNDADCVVCFSVWTGSGAYGGGVPAFVPAMPLLWIPPSAPAIPLMDANTGTDL